MEYHLWNTCRDKILFTGSLPEMVNAALHLVNNNCLSFDQFEITNYGESYLPWEPDFKPEKPKQRRQEFMGFLGSN